MMIAYFARKSLTKFARKYKCDMDYMIEMAEFYPAKAWYFNLATPLTRHFTAVPKELYFAVKIAASQLADCGTCTELVINVAISIGIDRQQLSYLVLGDLENMNGLTLLGYKYAMAVHQNSLDLLDIIDHIKIEYGKKGLWDVANAYNFGEFYPKLKRGLGIAVTCRPRSDMATEILNG